MHGYVSIIAALSEFIVERLSIRPELFAGTLDITYIREVFEIFQP